uniref:Uncharacterized protein n=1 Tax=Chenopodium quinoa TaxID=63459 RepID=A0A803MR73_CHEQI
MMASTLLATTAITLSSVIGVFVSSTSTVTNASSRLVFGNKSQIVSAVKYFALIICFLVAFLCNVQSLRYYAHVSFLATLPTSQGKREAMEYAARSLNRGSFFWTLGLRAFYLSFPLFLWIFGPIPMFGCYNPTALLVVVQYSGHNFIRWSRSVKCAFTAKNKDGFITGSIKQPEFTDKDYKKWKRADYMVVSWIMSSMNAELADDFAYIESSIKLLRELQERFGQSNGALIYQLKKEIDALKQENMTIIASYGKIKKLWDEFQSLRAFLIEKQKEVSGSGEIIAESSATVAQRMMRNGGQQRPNKGNFSQGSYNQGKRDWKKEKIDKKCDHCKLKGHIIDQCLKLHGYPDWYNAIKASKGHVSQYVGNRMAANVNQEQAESPFDLNSNANSRAVDSEMLSAICQEVTRSMKGK